MKHVPIFKYLKAFYCGPGLQKSVAKIVGNRRRFQFITNNDVSLFKSNKENNVLLVSDNVIPTEFNFFGATYYSHNLVEITKKKLLTATKLRKTNVDRPYIENTHKVNVNIYDAH